MNNWRRLRFARVLVTGAFLLQAGGCGTVDLFQWIQTILLGVTAAGSVAILQNI